MERWWPGTNYITIWYWNEFEFGFKGQMLTMLHHKVIIMMSNREPWSLIFCIYILSFQKITSYKCFLSPGSLPTHACFYCFTFDASWLPKFGIPAYISACTMSTNTEFNVMFQRLCENAVRLGSYGDIAGTRPILKELQAVLQRWDFIICLVWCIRRGIALPGLNYPVACIKTNHASLLQSTINN